MENRYLFTFDNYGYKRKAIYLALFTALAITMYFLEALIPKPIPFLKLGLANIIVLTLIVTKHIKEAFLVGVMKTIIGGVLIGTLFSPTTIMSISGTIVSIAIMSCMILLKIKFSILGISIIGAISHNITQLIIVRLILVAENKLFNLMPLLLVIGVATGIITGYFAHLFLQRISKEV